MRIRRIEGYDAIEITLTRRRWVSVGLNGWKGNRKFWPRPRLLWCKGAVGVTWLWFNADLWYDDGRIDS